ncbi:diphosphomevalonate decarboxylase [Lacticaseibacillus mingshuiensis]|uniref:diphosphomevalonate decarboxylase n=1 Tax=Lacticaseibacillus mingshuiensis TaxID=2799574 RepID=A0ABW4CFD0_9LACO|nr:diphosphomevalonate decarboxylase [Lacticaseibacillus mingshuiensis]
MTHAVTARAHTNIALIKYWGKRDAKLILPYTSSVSLTLADLYTDTTVEFDAALAADTFSLNGEVRPAGKISAFLDLVRAQSGTTAHAHVRSLNHVPTAAGLASSASAFAALAMAASSAAGLALSPTDLSRLARRGSGSASRSIFGGLAIWHRGSDDATSFAEPLPATTLPLKMIVVLVDQGRKAISSRQMMTATIATSPYFPAWVEHNEAAAEKMVRALAANDFAQVGALTEASSMQMHAAIMASEPPFTYFEPETLVAWQKVQALRAGGVPAYATMDAGPNVKILTLAPYVDAVVAALAEPFAGRLLTTGPGPAARILKEASDAI